jgi:hypothetical protein
MSKTVPIIGLIAATYFLVSTAFQFPIPPSSIAPATPPGWSRVVSAITDDGRGQPEPQGIKPSDAPPKTTPSGSQRSNEPAYKVLIRCLSDLDDVLDTIHDPATFAAAKPRILGRVRDHVAQVSALANPGMGRLSRSAAKEMQTAMNRHAKSLMEANQSVPGVTAFFDHEVAALLGAN